MSILKFDKQYLLMFGLLANSFENFTGCLLCIEVIIRGNNMIIYKK